MIRSTRHGMNNIKVEETLEIYLPLPYPSFLACCFII